MPTVDDILNRNRTLLPINDNDVRPGVVTINEQQLDAEKAKPYTVTPVTPIKPGSNTTAQQQAAGTVNTTKEQPTKKTVPTQTASSRIDAGALGNNAAGANVAGKTGVTVPGAPGSTTEQTAPKVVNGATEGPSKELDLNTEKKLNGYKYDLMLNALDKPETAEEKEKREKREKRERLFATIGDGLSAFHDAYSKARGVDSMIDTGISKHLQDRYDKLEAERDRRRDAYMRTALAINAQRQADEAGMDQQRYKNEMLKVRQQQQDRLEAQAGLALRKQDWLEKYQQGILDDKKERTAIEREYKQGLISKMERDAAIGELNAQTRYYNAHKSKSGGGGSYKPGNDPDMEKVTVKDPTTGETRVRWERRPTSSSGGSSSSGRSGSRRSGSRSGSGGRYRNTRNLGL